eukprot:2677068-Prymnesium_polylepis.1
MQLWPSGVFRGSQRGSRGSQGSRNSRNSDVQHCDTLSERETEEEGEDANSFKCSEASDKSSEPSSSFKGGLIGSGRRGSAGISGMFRGRRGSKPEGQGSSTTGACEGDVSSCTSDSNDGQTVRFSLPRCRWRLGFRVPRSSPTHPTHWTHPTHALTFVCSPSGPHAVLLADRL